MALTPKDRSTLFNLGIQVKYDGMNGNIITADLKGVWTLLNYLRHSGRRGAKLNIDLLKSLAAIDLATYPTDALRVVAPALPTHESKGAYCRMSMYLDNSPPTFMHDFPPMNGGVPAEYCAFRDPYKAGVGVFVLGGNQTLNIQFSADDVKTLNDGGCVVVSGKVLEAATP